MWVRAPPPVPNKQRPHPGVLLISCLWGSNPRALSKALGALCNPRRPAAHGRSSPTASSQASYRLRRLFMLCIKSHLALTPLLLLSESNPLHWASIWLYHTPPPNKQRPHLGTLLVSYNLQFEASRHNSLAPITVSARPTGTETATRRHLHPCRGLPSPDTARLFRAQIRP